MAMSASLTLVNNTGSTIMFTAVYQVNDDATWTAPNVGDTLPNNQSTNIAMGNSSVFFAPRGVGANVYFLCKGNFEMGQVYFDDPAVGAHSFNFGNTGIFNYTVTNPTGNSYVVVITQASQTQA